MWQYEKRESNFREEGILGAMVDPNSLKFDPAFCSPYISLNNVTGDAPPFDNSLEIIGHKFGFSYLPNYAFSSDRKSSKRDLLNSFLKERYPDAKWTNNFWDFVQLYRDAAEDIFGIRNSEYSLYRRYEFENCYWPKARGRVHTKIDNPEERYKERYHCGEPGCLLCVDLSRRRLAFEWILSYTQIVAGNIGFPGLLILEFTLPEENEAGPLSDKDLEKQLLDGIQRIVRRLFGLSSRSNIAINVCVHPVGSKNIFRDRWHVHAVVMPAVIETDKKTGEKHFRWVAPVQVASCHTQKFWKLDLQWLRDEWNEVLSSALGVAFPGAIQPQVEFILYSEKRQKLEGQEYEKKFWGKVAHRIKYAMRAFALDFENAVLRTDKGNKRHVVKIAKDGFEYWAVVCSVTLVERFKFIRKHNVVRSRGWAQSKKINSDLLGLIQDDPGKKPECLTSDAVIEVIRRKIFDKEKRKVVTERNEIWRFHCPVSHQDMVLDEKEMSSWKWNGRE